MTLLVNRSNYIFQKGKISHIDRDSLNKTIKGIDKLWAEFQVYNL